MADLVLATRKQRVPFKRDVCLVTRNVFLQEALAVDLAEDEVAFGQRSVVAIQARRGSDARRRDAVEDRSAGVHRAVLIQIDVAADRAHRVAQDRVGRRLVEDGVDHPAVRCVGRRERDVRIGDDRDRAVRGRVGH